MSQSGYTPILIYASGTATNVPLAANLTSSASGAELALNYADGKLYFKNSSGVVTLLSASGGGPAGGSNTQVQFNSSGVLAGSASFTWDGTTLVTPSHTTNTATTGSTNKGPLNNGTLSFSDTGIVQSAQTSVNSYFQNVIQNTSAGTAASAEFIAYNDQGTASTNYATVGINSSGYTGTGSINAPGYAYFLSASTDLVLGTIGANGIHFTTNSSATDALAISSAGAVSLPGGTANGVAYLNGSKVVTTGSALTFDCTNLGVGISPDSSARLDILAGTNARLLFRTGLLTGGTSNGFGLTSVTSDLSATAALNYRASTHAFIVDSSEQMRLTSTGLGIGTSSPATKINIGAGGVLRLNRPDNATYGDIYHGASGTGLVYNDANGDGHFWQLSGTTSLLLNSSGNLGLGVTPSAWSAGVKAIDLGAGSAFLNPNSSGQTWVYNNAYTNAGAKYKNSGLGAAWYQMNEGIHAWYTAPSGTACNAIPFTQAMTLDASGNLLVGTTSAVGGARQTVSFLSSSGGTGISLIDSQANNTATFAAFYSNTTKIGSITNNGNAAVLYNVTSDQRLKTNIADAAPASDLIDAIQVRQYDWKSDGSHQRYGFIAQELVTVAPEAVHQPADPEEMMAVDYSKLVPMLVKEIQDLRKRLAAAGI